MESPSSSPQPMNSVPEEYNITVACGGREVFQDHNYESLHASDEIRNDRILNVSCLTTKLQTVLAPLSNENKKGKTSIVPKRRPLKKRLQRNSGTIFRQQQEEQRIHEISTETMKSKGGSGLRNDERSSPRTKMSVKSSIVEKFPLPPRLTRFQARYFLTLPKHRVLFDHRWCFLRQRVSQLQWELAKSKSGVDISSSGDESHERHFSRISSATSSVQRSKIP